MVRKSEIEWVGLSEIEWDWMRLCESEWEWMRVSEWVRVIESECDNQRVFFEAVKY